MSKSIMQYDRYCYFCFTTIGLEKHHIFAGVANRKVSEANGLWVWLCNDCHTGKNGAQYNKELNLKLKQEAQRCFEEQHTRNEWMQLIRKNYLG